MGRPCRLTAWLDKHHGTVQAVTSLIAALVTVVTLGVMLFLACIAFRTVEEASKQTAFVGEQLRTTLSTARPFLLIDPIVKGDLQVIHLRASKTGPVPALITFKNAVVWFNGQPIPTTGEPAKHLIVHQERKFSILRQPVREEHRDSIRSGERKIAVAVCALYRSIDKSDGRRWLMWIHYRYSAKTKEFAIIDADDHLLSADDDETCDVAKITAEARGS